MDFSRVRYARRRMFSVTPQASAPASTTDSAISAAAVLLLPIKLPPLRALLRKIVFADDGDDGA